MITTSGLKKESIFGYFLFILLKTKTSFSYLIKKGTDRNEINFISVCPFFPFLSGNFNTFIC